jgi:hypothetical protein
MTLIGKARGRNAANLMQGLGAALSVAAIAGALFAVLFSSQFAWSQVGQADVLGTISDPSGAVIPNAKVTLKNLGTAENRATTTDDKGEYIINLLPIGSYSLSAEAKGFKLYQLQQFSLLAGDRKRLDASLEPGSVQEKVIVSSEAPVLQTDDSSVANTVEDQAVQDLPLNSRSFAGLIQIQPGVNAGNEGGTNGGPSHVTQEDWRPAFYVVANGQSDALNNYVIDGFDNNERLMGIMAVRPSIDGIAETEVVTNTYRAEWGRTAGAVLNVVTKQGSNTFHGGVYEFLRNDIFDAYDYNFSSGAAPPKAELRLNQFGGSIGGPIRKNKIFFFGDIEENRQIKGLSQTVSVPTAYEQSNPGDLSDCGGPNLVEEEVPLDPISLEYFKLYPLPPSDSSACINNYSTSPRMTQYSTTIDARLDEHFGSKDLFFARFGYNPSKTSVPYTFPMNSTYKIYPGMGAFTPAGWPGQGTETAQNIQADYVHIFSSNKLLDLKAGFTRMNISLLPWNHGLGAATASKLNIPGVIVAGSEDTDELPLLGAPSFPWAQLGDSPTIPNLDVNNAFQYSGSFTYTLGTHNLKLGAGLLRRQLNAFVDNNAAGAAFFFGGPPFGDPRADFFAGATTFEIRGNQLVRPGYRSWEPYVYVQDDWRATTKLTLNLGLRYDVFTPFTEAHGKYSNFDINTLSSGIGANNFILGSQSATVGVSTDYHDFAPRVGFAYSILPKTVLRGGFSISYYPADVGMTGNIGGAAPTSIVQNFNPPYAYSFFGFGRTLQQGMPVPQAVDLTSYNSNPNVTQLSSKALNLRSQYAEQMNLFLQREMGPNTLSIGYVGVLGRAMDRTINLMQPDPPCLSNSTNPECGSGLTYAQYGSLPSTSYVYGSQLKNVTNILYSYNGAMSAYHSMQVVYTLRTYKDLTLNSNYTWSHGFGTNVFPNGGITSNSNSSLDYGNSPYDIRSRFAASASYQLPFGKSYSGFAGMLVKGWQLNSIVFWQTGLPMTIADQTKAPNGNVWTNQVGVTQDRPNVNTSKLRSHGGVTNWFDLSAITVQTPGTQGNERNNQLFGPHDRRADLSLFKTFPIAEALKAQFRAECFNISNTPNFDQPQAAISAWNSDPVTGAPTTPVGYPFGNITSLAAGENPRQFQFALKLLF